MYFYIKSSIGPRVKLASCKSALNPTVVPVLVLRFVALWFILRGDLFKFCLELFCSYFFQSFEHWDYLARGRES